MKISVIISTYNWPEALKQTLLSLNVQTNKAFDVVIADDGSANTTKHMLQTLIPNLNFDVTHVWQPDEGFQLAKIRNKAIAASRGDYLVFIDHDCVPLANFIQNHHRLAQSGYFTSGQRILLDERITQLILSNNKTVLAKQTFFWFFKQYLKGHLNKLTSLLTLPLGSFRYRKKTQWKGANSLFGIWRNDLITVNGFDEQFQGWGYEDSDLVVRLFQQGIYRKLAKYACAVLHLYHPEDSSKHSEKRSQNWQRFQTTLNQKKDPDFPGVRQYL